MLAKDEDDNLMKIEFETALDSSVAAPESVSDDNRSVVLPMMVVLLLVGGLLVALVWFSSAADSIAKPRVLPIEDAESIEEAESPEEADDQEPDTNSVVPELSSAAFALEPTPLDDPSFATIFDGQLFALADGSIADELGTPPILRSFDGEDWEELATQATADGEPNAVGYSWSDIRASGGGLVASAFDFDRTRVSFISRNAIDWEEVAPDDVGKVFFEPLAIADEYVVGFSLGSSESLAQFVEDHTTAVDVADACFVASQAVIGCDQNTEWPFTEETIDSPVGSEAVFSCLNLLSVIGPDISLSRVGRDGFEVEPLDLRIYLSQFFPNALDDGRIAGIDDIAFFGDPGACDGIANVDEPDPNSFYVFDPSTGVVERRALDPQLNPSSTELLGKLSVTASDTFLFRSNSRLWTLDFAANEWTMLDDSQVGGQVAMADSGDRLYSFDGSDLSVIDLSITGQGIESAETSVYVVLPTDRTFSVIQSASAEDIIFQTEGSYWLLHVPSGIHCAQRYAVALAGNGLVEGC